MTELEKVTEAVEGGLSPITRIQASVNDDENVNIVAVVRGSNLPFLITIEPHPNEDGRALTEEEVTELGRMFGVPESVLQNPGA